MHTGTSAHSKKRGGELKIAITGGSEVVSALIRLLVQFWQEFRRQVFPEVRMRLYKSYDIS